MVNKQERLQLLQRQIARVERRLALLQRLGDRYSWARVAIFFVGVLLSIGAFFVHWQWGLALAVLTSVIFGVVASRHNTIERSIVRLTLWREIKRTHVARIQLNWSAIPAVEAAPALGEHPFAGDLDITGERSLHQLLNTAVSREGGWRLRDWLLTREPDLAVIRKRHDIIGELTPLTLFREKLTLKATLAGQQLAHQLEGQRLQRWLAQQNSSPLLLPLLWGSVVLNSITVILFVLNVVAGIPQYWSLALTCSLLLFFTTGNIRGHIFDDATYLRSSFRMLSSVFEYLERSPYGQRLSIKHLCEPFWLEPGLRPSALLRGTARIAAAAMLEKNRLLWILVNAFVPWDLYCAYRLQYYTERIAERLPKWLDAWFELEALSSLATFAYLNPEYVVPEIVPNEEGGRADLFRAQRLGHPLLPAEKKVTNDVVLNDVVIITGSNMSGKSTFLRSLGVNLCLAYAGGSVNAQRLQTTLFRLFTCIRVSDSLADGYSYFYAEVRRLKALLVELEREHPMPLFFLIDEIFKGTNNRERLIGSRAYVRALVGRHCLGCISTHDLELVSLANVLPGVTNAHFREDVKQGRMVFDYVLRAGPCPTTNALKIMELEGLPIEDQEEESS